MGLFDIFKKKEKCSSNEIPPELQNIAKMLNEVKNTGTLPCRLQPDILENLKIIANTPNWHLMLQGEIITNLNKIYDKWQRSLSKTSTSYKVKKIDTSGGFEKKYWEGTFEEYKEACENNVIDENTIVEIIEDEKNYHGAWIGINENGDIEEWME